MPKLTDSDLHLLERDLESLCALSGREVPAASNLHKALLAVTELRDLRNKLMITVAEMKAGELLGELAPGKWSYYSFDRTVWAGKGDGRHRVAEVADRADAEFIAEAPQLMKSILEHLADMR